MAQGMRNGTWVALWALLPALLLGWVSGDYGTGFLLLSVYVGAAVLAQTLSLSLALIAIIPVSAVGGFVLLTFNTAFLEAMLSMLDAWIAALQSESPEAGDSLNALRPTANQVAGLMATGNAFLASLSLLLGRYWQAALFKPGAFGEEFRALKLPGALTASLVLVAMAGALNGSETAAWSAVGGYSRNVGWVWTVSPHCKAPAVGWYVSNGGLCALGYRRRIKSRRVISGFVGCVSRFGTPSEAEMSLEKVGHSVLKVEGKIRWK
jgi:hypothetical protein